MGIIQVNFELEIVNQVVLIDRLKVKLEYRLHKCSLLKYLLNNIIKFHLPR